LEKVHNEGRILYSLIEIVRENKSRRMRLAVHVAPMGAVKDRYIKVRETT
jgi:hypothetical protein